jgi:hypothetical protein
VAHFAARLGEARRFLTITCLVAGSMLSLALAPQAAAYRIAGQPWPYKKLTYYSLGSKRANRIVDRAARIWNRARIGLRFSRARASSADVLVSGSRGRCRGKALIGFPGARVSWLHVARCPEDLMVLVVAHEFGHVLGLGHEPRRCALMDAGMDSGTGTPSRCRPRTLTYWVGHALQPDDVRGARALNAHRNGVTQASPHAAAQNMSEPAGLYDFLPGLLG